MKRLFLLCILVSAALTSRAQTPTTPPLTLNPDTATGLLALREYPVQQGSDLAFSPDGQSLAVAAGREGLLVFGLNAPTTDPIAQLTLDARASAVTFSPEGTQIAVGDWLGGLVLIDFAPGVVVGTATLTPTITLSGHSAAVRDLAYAPDGRLASGGADRLIHLWDSASTDPTTTLSGHGDWVNALAWSTDSTQILSGDAGNRLILWDTAAAEIIAQNRAHHYGINAVTFSPDHTQALSAANDGQFRTWTADDLTELRRVQAQPADINGLNAADWNAQGVILSAGWDATLRLWAADSPADAPLATFTQHSAPIIAARFSPDGSQIATLSLGGSSDPGLILWGFPAPLPGALPGGG